MKHLQARILHLTSSTEYKGNNMNTFGRNAAVTLEIRPRLVRSWVLGLKHSNKEGWKFRLQSPCAVNDSAQPTTGSNFPGRVSRVGRAAGMRWIDVAIRGRRREHCRLRSKRKRQRVSRREWKQCNAYRGPVSKQVFLL